MPSHRDTAGAHFFGLDAAGKKAVQSASFGEEMVMSRSTRALRT
jgi:hypothetical protein